MFQGLSKNLIFACTVAALGSGFQHGYNTGVVNAPEKVLRNWIEGLLSSNGTIAMDSEDMKKQTTLIFSVIVSIYCLGGMCGGLITNIWSKIFGRRGGIMANNIFIFAAAALMGLSKNMNSYVMLIVGRFIVGINSGLNAGLVPMYLSEVPPIELRGAIGSVYQLFITISILISQLISTSVALGTEKYWPILFYLVAVISVGQLLLFPFCADSPRYLYQKGKVEAAEKALKWLRSSDDIQEELDRLQKETEAEIEGGRVGLFEILAKAEFRKPLIISCVIMLAQQWSGINAVIFYSTSIFKEGAQLGDAAAEIGTIIMGIVNVAMTIISVLIVDKAGRKTLLVFGFAAMFIDTTLLCISSVVATKNPNLAMVGYASVVLVLLYIIFFASGAGSIPWFLVSELFLQSARPTATSIAVALNWLGNFVVGLLFPTLQYYMGPYVFAIFAVLQLIFVIYIIIWVPETKNRPIEEIVAQFKKEE